LYIFAGNPQNKKKVSTGGEDMFRFFVLLSFLIFGVIYRADLPVQIQSTVEVDATEKAIQQLIKQKEDAVNGKDQVRFLAVISGRDPFYSNEQKRWFADAIRFIDPGSFQLKVTSMTPRNENLFQVWVQQTYKRHGDTYDVRYPLLIKKTEQGWKDVDLAFRQISHSVVTIRFMDESLLDEAQTALDTLQRAVYLFRHRYGWVPKRVEVKLYQDTEMFRQSVKPSLPSWAAGWHESGESIKFVAGMSEVGALSSGLVHELTHQMMSELTHDNAAYWLQEGAAMYYERHLLPGLYRQQDAEQKSKVPLLPLSQLEQINLEKLSNQEAYQYYQSCYHLFQFMIKQYGEKHVQDLLTVLKRSEEIQQDSADKMKFINGRTREAMKQILGVSIAELDRKWSREENGLK
jgi:hypothetical protein